MPIRLLLVLIFAFATPPMPAAACHGMGPAAGAQTMAGMDHPAPVPPSHDCVGCIAVADWDGARIAPPIPVAAPVLTASVAAMPLLPGHAPTPPPPRIA